MNDLIAGLSVASGLVRTVVLGAVAIAAVIASIDWLVRTRRLSPFGPIGRFFRRRVDPLMAPVERRLLGHGLRPGNAPWWAALGIVVFGLLAIALVDFLIRIVVQASLAMHAGPSMILRLLVVWTIGLLQIALFVRVITSWLSISPYAGWVRWSYRLTEWFLAPLRRVLPPMGMIDLSPLVAYFGLWLLESLVT